MSPTHRCTYFLFLFFFCVCVYFFFFFPSSCHNVQQSPRCVRVGRVTCPSSNMEDTSTSVIPEALEPWVQILVPQPCYDKFFIDFDFLNGKKTDLPFVVPLPTPHTMLLSLPCNELLLLLLFRVTCAWI